MHKLVWLAGLTLAMVWTATANAQSTSGSSSSIPAVINNIIKFPKSLNINVQPNITNNSPMDYRNQNLPIGTTIYRPTFNGSAFPLRLSQWFYQPRRTNYISSTTNFGVSIFPTPAQMQAAAPSYFVPFQMYRAAPITP